MSWLRGVWLHRLILKRERNGFDKLSLAIAKSLLVRETRRLSDSSGELLAKRRIAVLAYSDTDYDLSRQLSWGDYWFKYELIKALGALGYLVTESQYRPDVVIHLFGSAMDLPDCKHKIIWIHSNPDKISSELLRRYNKIYCISSQFTRKIRRMGFECEVVPPATSKRPRRNPIRYDVSFIGNARAEAGGRRQIVEDVGAPAYRFQVWGRGYADLPRKYWAGEYLDYPDVGDIYSASLISLNDHRPAMAAEGFITPRVFDILASGGFCISDPNPVLTETFGEAVPQYESPGHLRELIDFYLHHPDQRMAMMDKGREIALAHTWEAAVRRLVEGIGPMYS